MATTISTVSDEVCAEYAAKALTRPGSFAAWDERMYTTHGCVYAWADRGDDVLSESNYHVMLDRLRAVVEAWEPSDREDDVLDLRCSHWLVGSLEEIFVRVYEDDGERFTPAFREAAGMLAALSDYPILDDSDYSDREYKAWGEIVEMALDDAARPFRDEDDPTTEQMFYTLLTIEASMDTWGYPAEEVRWDKVAADYAEVRNAHYEWLARWHMAPYVPPGQLTLPGLDRQ